MKKLATLLAMLLLLTGCASLPPNTQQIYSEALTCTGDTRLGRDLQYGISEHPGSSGFLLLDNGLDAFVARIALIKAAELCIDVQYYLYHDDLIGHLMAYYLLRAADRGVRVRILLDDISAGKRRDIYLAVFDSHPNIQIRLFNPFSRGGIRSLQFLTRFGSVTRRMHNKSLTVDNQVTIVGGRNIGNAYFDADPELLFGDIDAMAIGPVVPEISRSFDKFWNNELAYPIASLTHSAESADRLEQDRPRWDEFIANESSSEYYQALQASDMMQKLRSDQLEFDWGAAKVLYDRPQKITSDVDDERYHMAPMLKPYVEQVAGELIVITPYFVPGTEGVEFFTELVKRGVRVKILTNSLASTDVAVVHAGYAKYRKPLLRAGVELYELDKVPSHRRSESGYRLSGSSRASLHGKAFVFDRKILFIGSLNLDPRSFNENTEIGILFDSPTLGEEIGESIDDRIGKAAFKVELFTDNAGVESLRWVDTKQGEIEYFYTDPHTSFWKRLWVGLAGLLPIESQL